MRASHELPRGEQVVVRAPIGRDGPVLCRVLEQAGIASASASSLIELIDHIRRGVGLVVVTTEALTLPEFARLKEVLSEQPPWSELPVLVLLPAGADPSLLSSGAVASLISMPGVIVHQRPVPAITLITSVQSALNARRRQYELRDLLLRERAAREQAEAAGRVKDEFLSVVSHELRTPLASILIWVRMLVAGKLRAEQTTRALRSMLTSAEALARLVEDLLDMGRAISGKLRIETQRRPLGPILSGTLEIVRPVAESRNIRLDVEFDAQPELVLVDPDRAQQMFWNLLSNAIKFTPRGGTVSVRMVREQNDLSITVSDTGQGISPEVLPHVFERFRQEDSTVSRRHGGLGLGLAIVQQLVELHGGTISVQSEGKGKGASFTVRLPIVLEQSATQAPTVTATVPPSEPLRGVRVLLAEDDPETRLALSCWLENAGASVTAVRSGAAALSMISSALPDRRPHVLISDVAMPGMDGLALIDAVRSEEQRHDEPRLPAIALTAYARDDERKRVLEAGYDVHLTKPLASTALESTVRQLLEAGAALPVRKSLGHG